MLYSHRTLRNPDATLGSVLVVEDEWLILADLVTEWKHAGWEVVEARTGESALQELEANQSIDLLITDIRLAGHLSGWDVAEAARIVRPTLPVIYTSGNSANKSRQVDGSVFLSKPCQTAEVVQVGCDLLTRQRTRLKS